MNFNLLFAFQGHRFALHIPQHGILQTVSGWLSKSGGSRTVWWGKAKSAITTADFLHLSHPQQIRGKPAAAAAPAVCVACACVWAWMGQWVCMSDMGSGCTQNTPFFAGSDIQWRVYSTDKVPQAAGMDVKKCEALHYDSAVRQYPWPILLL